MWYISAPLLKARVGAKARYPCAAPRLRPVLVALLRRMGGFGGGAGVSLCRCFRALWVGSGGVLGGHFVQQSAPMLGGYGLFKESLELFLGQWYAVGDKAFKKPHAAAEAFCPVLALLRLLLLHKLSAPVFKLSDFFLNPRDFSSLVFGISEMLLSFFGVEWIG